MKRSKKASPPPWRNYPSTSRRRAVHEGARSSSPPRSTTRSMPVNARDTRAPASRCLFLELEICDALAAILEVEDQHAARIRPGSIGFPDIRVLILGAVVLQCAAAGVYRLVNDIGIREVAADQ